AGDLPPAGHLQGSAGDLPGSAGRLPPAGGDLSADLSAVRLLSQLRDVLPQHDLLLPVLIAASAYVGGACTKPATAAWVTAAGRPSNAPAAGPQPPRLSSLGLGTSLEPGGWNFLHLQDPLQRIDCSSILYSLRSP